MNKYVKYGIGSALMMLVLLGSYFIYSFLAPMLGLEPTPELGFGFGPFVFGAVVMFLLMIARSNIEIARKAGV
jgi:hypothetical protein